jgi:rare lipoprotein A
MKTLLFLILLIPVVTVAEAGITSSNGRVIAGTASWYDSASVKREGTCHAEKCYTASGKEIHDLERKGTDFCAASKAFRMGARLKVTNPSNKLSVVVTVVDRGGFKKYGRLIDLSRQSFSKISDLKKGVIKVDVQIL